MTGKRMYANVRQPAGRTARRGQVGAGEVRILAPLGSHVLGPAPPSPPGGGARGLLASLAHRGALLVLLLLTGILRSLYTLRRSPLTALNSLQPPCCTSRLDNRQSSLGVRTFRERAFGNGGVYLTAGSSLWRSRTAVRRPGVTRGRFRVELMRVRRWSTGRVVTVRVQAVRRVVLRVLQPRDYPFVLFAKVPSHQRRFTHNHHVLHRQESRNRSLNKLPRVRLRMS